MATQQEEEGRSTELRSMPPHSADPARPDPPNPVRKGVNPVFVWGTIGLMFLVVIVLGLLFNDRSYS